LRNKDILKIQEILEWNNAGFRTQSGTKLKNDQTGETIYTPPQDISEIKLIKMAIIHHQFESIHPFYDWNGRTGRIINILYLAKNDLLDMPILYLSSYIIKHKSEYYRLLQDVRESGNWDEWILYMLEAVQQTSKDTMEMIWAIWTLMWTTKESMKIKVPKIYSKDLLEILFSHPYTKIEFLVDEIWMSRQRASRYLQELVDTWYMLVIQIKQQKYFINIDLFNLLKKWL